MVDDIQVADIVLNEINEKKDEIDCAKVYNCVRPAYLVPETSWREDEGPGAVCGA